MEAVFIFPHHLFDHHPCLHKQRMIFLIEDRRFFSDFLFHKQKLIFHRACLKNYEKLLQEQGYTVKYIEDDLETIFKNHKIGSVHVVELDDVELEKRLQSSVKEHKATLTISQTPLFLTTIQEFQEVFQEKKHFSFEKFYIYQRKTWNLLLDENGKPYGGKWSFDKENRNKLPKNIQVPEPRLFGENKAVQEAIQYITHKYPHHPGSGASCTYPTTHKEAKLALKNFLETRLHLFGCYEDAIVQQEEVLFHSQLSLLINVGLLAPSVVVEETISYGEKTKIPLNNLEGFIRQVVGWREFVRGVYHLVGKTQRKKNFFAHHKKMPQQFYDASTGILPVDVAIKKLLLRAYLHHIERLMVLGNFFLLCEISPDEIYHWFMELFIDAYDWVMVPNIYGMSQYADGGMMTTKPYFSGSNYLLKMSDYPKGEWCTVWDALFWRFMNKHAKFFEIQPRLSMLCAMAKKKKKDKHLQQVGEEFLKHLK